MRRRDPLAQTFSIIAELGGRQGNKGGTHTTNTHTLAAAAAVRPLGRRSVGRSVGWAAGQGRGRGRRLSGLGQREKASIESWTCARGAGRRLRQPPPSAIGSRLKGSGAKGATPEGRFCSGGRGMAFRRGAGTCTTRHQVLIWGSWRCPPHSHISYRTQQVVDGECLCVRAGDTEERMGARQGDPRTPPRPAVRAL